MLTTVGAGAIASPFVSGIAGGTILHEQTTHSEFVNKAGELLQKVDRILTDCTGLEYIAALALDCANGRVGFNELVKVCYQYSSDNQRVGTYSVAVLCKEAEHALAVAEAKAELAGEARS